MQIESSEDQDANKSAELDPPSGCHRFCTGEAATPPSMLAPVGQLRFTPPHRTLQEPFTLMKTQSSTVPKHLGSARTATALLIAISVFPAPAVRAQAQVPLISTGAVWKYCDTGTDQATTWRPPSCDDAPANQPPVITWPAPEPMVYGTSLSSVQLNATFTLVNVQLSNEGRHAVAVYSSAGSFISADAWLMVLPPDSGAVSLDLNLSPNAEAQIYPCAVVVQPDWKIVIGGQFTAVNDVSRRNVACLSNNVPEPPCPALAEAVDACNLLWRTSGDAP